MFKSHLLAVGIVLSSALSVTSVCYAQSESTGESAVSVKVGSAEKGSMPVSTETTDSGSSMGISGNSEDSSKGTVGKESDVPPVVHPKVGESLEIGNGVSIQLVGKLQNYYWGKGSGSDADIISPKSVNIHP